MNTLSMWEMILSIAYGTSMAALHSYESARGHRDYRPAVPSATLSA
jgi:hypothetical protein